MDFAFGWWPKGGLVVPTPRRGGWYCKIVLEIKSLLFKLSAFKMILNTVPRGSLPQSADVGISSKETMGLGSLVLVNGGSSPFPDLNMPVVVL